VCAGDFWIKPPKIKFFQKNAGLLLFLGQLSLQIGVWVKGSGSSMLEYGFIMLPRTILDWQWYDEPNTMRLYLHLLLTANYSQKEWHGITICRGQRVCTLAGLSRETGLSVQQVRTILRRLETSGEIVSHSTSQYTLLTIEHYDQMAGTSQKPESPALAPTGRQLAGSFPSDYGQYSGSYFAATMKE